MRPQSICITVAALIAALTLPFPVHAALVKVPLALDYRILEQALAEQFFTEADKSVTAFKDSSGCNSLVLSEPQVGGTDEGMVRLLSTMTARTGTPLGDTCRLAKTWSGLVETLQTARVDPQLATVSFSVVDSRLLKADDQSDALPRFLRKWINDYVHPRLGAVSIDLEPGLSGIEELLDVAIVNPEADPAGESPPVALQIEDIRPSAAALTAILSAQVADAPPGWTPPVEKPLTEEELARWDEAWQAWDGFATWLVKTLALSADPELDQALAEILLEARYELRDALAKDDRDRDPVRDLFLSSWERLAPLLGNVQLGLPGSRALPFAAFVGGANALQALDQLAPHLGVRLDQHALRSLARVLVPGVSDYDLRYDTTLDPELRELLGLDPDFEEAQEPDQEADRDADPESGEESDGMLLMLLNWLVPSSHAAQIPPDLARQLNGWVPARKEIDRYLDTMQVLLDVIAEAERGKGKVPAEYFGLYDALLRATAWQESCWRQYVLRNGAVEAIKSSAGSVGLMQVNVHVWRGVYDVDAIANNVGYNARAGNEILVHYLVDYAIRKKEHEINNDPENLVRATYAMYNGGPRHRSRYRDPKVSASLKKIDDSFWLKYHAIQAEGSKAVRPCLAG
jgi:hypothetical protein